MLYPKVKYDLQIRCSGEQPVLYINGSNPVQAQEHLFQNQEADHLLLYLGDYSFKETPSVIYLNAEISKVGEAAIEATVDRIQRYYAETLAVPEHKKLVMGKLFSIGRPDQYSNWALAEYPAILMDIEQLAYSLGKPQKALEDINNLRILAHEMAHQYWGLTLRSTTPYWGFYSESLAEYFSLKILKFMCSKAEDEAYLNHRYLTERSKSRTFQPLHELDGDVRIRDWYYYYPMVLLGLEQEVGEEKMNQFLKNLLNSTDHSAISYAYFRATGLQSGIRPEAWARFEARYVQTKNCLEWIVVGQ
ncbi:MAG: hypothetical protein KDC44_15995 [Phaeodactylibacter sp.]|nr:hypothetical protein [Phaeodactylibacter sp.]